MALREVVVELGVDVDKRAQQKAESAISRIRKGLGSIAVAGAKMGLVFGGVAAVGLFKVVEAASDANEQLNVIDSIFGKQLTPSIVEWSRITARAMNQSSQEVLGFTANMSALVKPMLGNNDAALKMSKGVAKLAFDMASFLNLEPSEALEKLRAGLVGSSEPLLTVGIDTRVAALEQFRLAKGINKSFKEMTQAEQTQLRFALITERFSSGIGDAAKTQRGFANAMRGLRGAVRDTSAEVGQVFIPIAEDLLATITPIIRDAGPFLTEVFKGWIESGKEAFKRLKDFGAFLADAFQPAVDNIVEAFSNFTSGTDEQEKSTFTLRDALTALAFVLQLITDVILRISVFWKSLDKDQKSLIQTLLLLRLAFGFVRISAIKAALATAAAWLKSNFVVKAFSFTLRTLATIFRVVRTSAVVAWLASVAPLSLIIGLIVGLIALAVFLAVKFKEIPNAILDVLGDALGIFLKFFTSIFGISDRFNDAIVEGFKNSWNKIIELGSKAFKKLFGFVGDIFGLDFNASVEGQTASPAGGSFGGGLSEAIAGFSPTAASIPSALMAKPTSIVNAPNQEVNLTVNAQTNASPSDIAGEVKKQLRVIDDELNRETMQDFLLAGATG